MSDDYLLEVQRRLQQQRGIKPPPPTHDAAAVADAMINLVAGITEKAAQTESEYLADDGLLHCTICDGPRQTVITPPFEGAQPRTVRCWCNCPTDYEKLQATEKLWQMETARNVCFKGFENCKAWTFDKDDGRNQELTQAAREYADKFPEYLRTGKGLLLYGPVGTGKSVITACIANAVMEKGYRVKMTSISDVADELWVAEDKGAYLRHLVKYDLLILDDLGAERNTPYMQEMVYKVINARYADGRPMLITTNLTREELGNPADIGNKRSYSRALERCLCIHVGGADRRMQEAGKNKNEMRKALGIGGAGS